MDKEKQIDIVSKYHQKENLANTLYLKQDEFDLSNPFEVANCVINLGYRKINDNEVVIRKDNYEIYKQVLAEWSIMKQENFDFNKPNENEVVISKGEYEELIKLQQTYAEDLTNAIQSYEEREADLKINYNNHIKNLEKIIDRQSKDLNSQADRLIDLKEQLKEMEEQRDEQAYITEDLIQEKHLWTEQARKKMAKEILEYIEQNFSEEWSTVDCLYDVHEWISNTFDVEIGEEK